MRRLLTAALLFSIAACDSQQVATEPSLYVIVELQVYDDAVQQLDACGVNLSMMDGNAYGLYPVSCTDAVATYAAPRYLLPGKIYFLDWSGAVQGPKFQLDGDEDLVRLAVRVRPGWHQDPGPSQ